MNIGLAQISPNKGDIALNIDLHIEMIERAASRHADALFFPELSLTGYEPTLASKLKMTESDERLDVFQSLSDLENIILGIGAPIIKQDDIEIAMLIFKPNQPISKYAKQILHEDEHPYFTEGSQQILIIEKDVEIAPAICYESLQKDHIDEATKKGANIYLASVAKSENGIIQANKYYPKAAQQNKIPILMTNCYGPCDDFISTGQSAVWDKSGKKATQLPSDQQGIIIYETDTEMARSFLF